MLANGAIKSADCFDLRYRVTRQGKVEKLSELVVPVESTSCGY